MLLVLAGLALARAPAAGEPPSVEFLPGALEPGTWIEWSETLRLPAPEAPSTSAASGATKEPGLVLKANGITACFGGPEGVPNRILDSVLDWSLDDGSGEVDRSATGVQLLGLWGFSAPILRIGQAETDSSRASEWLIAHGAWVFGPRDGRLPESVLPDIGDTGEYPQVGMAFSRVRSGAVSIRESIGLSRTVRVTKGEWERKFWINARVHAPDLPGVWDRAFRSRMEQGTCWLQGTVTCRRTAAGGTETRSLLEGKILRTAGAAPSGAASQTRWTEERTAILHVRGEAWTPRVVGTPPPCEVSRLVHVGELPGQLESWGFASRLAGHRCWVAPLVGLAESGHLYTYPNPVDEVHLDRFVGEDPRGHVVSLVDHQSAAGDPVPLPAMPEPLRGARTFTWEPSANGPIRVELLPLSEAMDVPGMGWVVRLADPDGRQRRGQPIFSEEGRMLGVAVQAFGGEDVGGMQPFLAPVVLREAAGGALSIPSAAWTRRLKAGYGHMSEAPAGKLEALAAQLSKLVTHTALAEIEQYAITYPDSQWVLSLLARARTIRGEYAAAARADASRRDRWPAWRIAGEFRAWQLLRDEVVLSKGNDHCELHARTALSWAPSDPALQDAVLTALCRCEAYETAADLVLQLGLSRPGSVGDLRTVHAYLVREGDAERAARVEALVHAASGPR